MKKLKFILRILRRHFKSLYWWIRLVYRNRNVNIGEKILKDLGKFENVHLLCPGSSLDLIKTAKIKKNSIIIFINHSLNICDMKSLDGFTKVAFTSDPIRAKEIIQKKNHKLNICRSVLFPKHIFNLEKEVFRSYEFIFNIFPKLSKSYGIVGADFSKKESIVKPDKIFQGFGYGSLNGATIFSLIFDPKEIHFWGCDFYSPKGGLYSKLAGGNKYAYNVDFSYYEEKTKKDFYLLEEVFLSKGIRFILHQKD